MHSFLASPGATIETLQRFGLHTKKALGQHFLVDDHVIGKILELADVQPGDDILEVGPGIGTLTVALLGAGANVTSIERDRDLIPVLSETTALGQEDSPRPPRFTLLEMDALQLGTDSLGDAHPTKFVANLPYAVAATLVLDYFQRIESLESATVMVQAEVADRMRAVQGTKDYGAYSVKIALLCETTGAFPVKPGSFLPPPRVDSTVIRLDRRADGGAAGDRELLREACRMADAAFFQRRKTIRNSMQSFFAQNGDDSKRVDALLEATGIDPRSRGEQHAPEVYLALARAARA
ncbi:MAG: 16S rRNA (adenine(1518)-N(6)/adenine(1519)-N(6))-dimethyltransferase RsmA [Coriobacteriales bacterium]|jgi:16S rRNA (adenine1518-N6/adenine1519-N6)-dimethyltransferase